ncbi:hypothetical protein PG997_010949 [Apiospora hydei]|uniref:Uncharacterized protein n=1 Tax=Apiospora hydei TaxID=1337664 RepID=A0ABR1VKB6_9PEZI
MLTIRIKHLTTSLLTPRAIDGLIGSLPRVFLFVWLLLLVGQLSNQSAVGAPEEDALNKLYRPIPVALSVHWEAATFIAMVYVYNDLGGADVPIARQLLNGAALALLCGGALNLAAYSDGSTVNAEGYAARGRKTLPLVLGDAPARWATIVLMLLWNVNMPWLCGAGLVVYWSSVASAGVAAVGLAVWRTPGADARSYKMWSVWLADVYIMPWMALLG